MLALLIMLCFGSASNYAQQPNAAAIREGSKREGSYIIKETDIEMVLVEGGMEFPMTHWNSDQKAEYINKTVVNSFYISRFEITELQWKKVMGDDYRVTDCDSCPITRVSFNEAFDFTKRLSNLAGEVYRLPRNAEWEYAARGGRFSHGFKYPGSNYLGEVAWYRLNSGLHIHKIGGKKPNELGLYDMAGNIDEICMDWSSLHFSQSYVEKKPSNPTGPDKGNQRVYRGGNYCSGDENIMCTYNRSIKPDDSYQGLGFRIVRKR